MVWKVVKSAQPPVRYRPNSDRRPDIVDLSMPMFIHYFFQRSCNLKTWCQSRVAHTRFHVSKVC